MSPRHRALVAAGTLVACVLTSVAFGGPIASAHVHVTSADAAPGQYALLTFSVPNESETGALTTQLSVALPNVAAASTETLPGWTAKLDRDAAAGTVRSVTWTADPRVGIPADQFGLFRLSVKLPDAQSVPLPATQTYSDGTVVKWDEPTAPGGAEPEHPAPVLELTTGRRGDAGAVEPRAGGQPVAAAPDDTARWLAGAALVVAAAGLVTALVRGRRT